MTLDANMRENNRRPVEVTAIFFVRKNLLHTQSSRELLFCSIAGNAYAAPSTMGGCTGSEADKQIGLWERRIKGLRRMMLGWEQARPPDAPHSIQLDVTSCTTVLLRILESVDGPIATKCKGEFGDAGGFGCVQETIFNYNNEADGSSYVDGKVHQCYVIRVNQPVRLYAGVKHTLERWIRKLFASTYA